MGLKDRLQAMPVIGTAMEMQERTKADAADQFAAAIAFFGFVSLFPLLAVAVAIGGMILADLPGGDVDELVAGIQEAIPGLGGDTLDGAIQAVIDNASSIGWIALATSLFTGLRITNAAQTATQFVFGMRLEDVNAVKARLLQLLALVVLGLLSVGGVALSGWVTALAQSTTSGTLGSLAGLLGSAVLDVLLFWVAYRLFSNGSGLGWGQLLPGALLGGIGWSALKYFGGSILSRQANSSALADSSAVGATILATVLGLLAVFYLAGRLYVYGAELSAVLADVGRDSRRGPGDLPEVPPNPSNTSGGRAGLLAALQAHERARGVDSPPLSDADKERAALFARHAPASKADPGDAGGDDGAASAAPTGAEQLAPMPERGDDASPPAPAAPTAEQEASDGSDDPDGSEAPAVVRVARGAATAAGVVARLRRLHKEGKAEGQAEGQSDGDDQAADGGDRGPT